LVFDVEDKQIALKALQVAEEKIQNIMKVKKGKGSY